MSRALDASVQIAMTVSGHVHQHVHHSNRAGFDESEEDFTAHPISLDGVGSALGRTGRAAANRVPAKGVRGKSQRGR